ncbi:MAG: NAD-dependent epimerase/dehydratase family protein [Solirubrobacterales bacterium]
MSARRALVTGGAGFIGAGLTRRLLADGHRVELLLRPGSDAWRLDGVRDALVVHEADLRDRDAVRAAVAAAEPEWIFHLAAHGAYSWQTDAAGIFQSNLLGTLNLLESSVERGFDALVHAGTSSEYGLKDHAPGEDEAPEPNSSYAVAKVAATLLCRQLAEQHGLHLSTLRLYSVYGPWEDPRRLMPTLAAHGMRGELPPLVDPETARDFVHLDDVLDAFLLAAAEGAPRPDAIYNVGSGVQTSLRSVVETARAALAIAVEPSWGSHPPRAWDTNVWAANPEKIERELGWHPRVALEAGFATLVDWLRANPRFGERYGVRA